MSEWHASVVDRLRRQRAAGFDFKTAWQLTMRLDPPRGSFDAVATDERGELILFGPEAEKAPTESALSFFRRVCDEAWHDRPNVRGERAAVRHFSPDLVPDVDDSRPAMRSSRRAAA